MKKLIYIPMLLLVMSGGCKKEAKLTPTPDPEDVYGSHTLPQGNHDYDAAIGQLYSKYGTLFLYKYKPTDLYYNIDQNIGGTYDSVNDKTTKAGYFDVPADQAYIGQQLDQLGTLWLNYYPDSLLKKGLPIKIFLLDSFYFAYTGAGKPIDNWPEFHDVFAGGDYILTTWGGERIAAMTPEEAYTWKGQLNAAFLAYAHAKGAIKMSPAFTALTDYAAVTYSNYNDLGILDWYYASTPDKDWDAYATAIVSNSYETLTAPYGILSPDVDTKGVIRKKYDVMINYFKALYGVDLQAIGNAGL